MIASVRDVPERTLLKVFLASDLLVPLYSSRNLKQDLDDIDAASFQRRTVNMVLRNLSPTTAQKYKTTITCTDWRPIALAACPPGTILVIECVKLFGYRTGTPGQPNRTAVADSTFEEGNFTFYRPRLTMMLKRRPGSVGEYTGDESWTIEAEEV